MIRALLALLLLLTAAPAGAQSARVLAPAEALRSGPGATAYATYATLSAGTSLQVGPPRAGWREATLEGWVPAASVRTDASGTGVVVTAPAGEEIHVTAGGASVGRIAAGVLLERVEQSGPWIRVRRSGWVRDGGVRVEGGRAAPAQVAPPAAPAPGTRVGAGGAPLLARPGADTVASVRPFGAVEVLGRQGGWTRVRVEGWVWTPSLAGAADSAGVLTDLTAAALLANPDMYRGRVVAWDVQFIALRTAEPIRADFQSGEPFVLARGPGRETGFVYVGVPGSLLAAVRKLQPLQRVGILARVRIGRSPLMGAPVLELIELH